MASAEFLKTVYEYGIGENEQDAPIVLMYSDPTFPDRTDSFLAGESELLLARLTGALQSLSDAGASRFVICCMTIHYLLPRSARPLGRASRLTPRRDLRQPEAAATTLINLF